VGASNQQVSHLELGKRQLTVEWLRRLADALDCHPWEMIEATLLPKDEIEVELISAARGLPASQLEEALSILRGLSKPGSTAKRQRKGN
jgi:hypothetical protein